MSLEKIREKIDEIDSNLLELLNTRMEQVLLLKRFKDNIEDKNRENQILKKVINNKWELVDKKFSEDIFSEILKHSKKLQKKNYSTIAFLGSHGNFTEEAAKKCTDNVITIPVNSINELFFGLEIGQYDYGFIPKNIVSTEIITEQKSISIESETIEKTTFNLMTHPDNNFDEIDEIYVEKSNLKKVQSDNRFANKKIIECKNCVKIAKYLSSAASQKSAVLGNKNIQNYYNLKIVLPEFVISGYNNFLILKKDSQ